MTAALFTYQVIDASSRVVPGAKVSFMQGFRKGPVWHDPEMRTPARNPYITDGAGRVALYLKAGETYEITIETPKGDRVQFTHVARADGEVIRETVTERVEVPVERVVYQDSPETLRKLAEMEALLAAASAPKPEPVKPEGAFDSSQLSDLIRENEPHADAQRRWLSDFTQLTNRLVDIRLPDLNDTERSYQRRLQAALYSSRRGAVETI